MQRLLLIPLALLLPLMAVAQMGFDEYYQQHQAKFEKYRQETQNEYDAYRKMVNDAYAEYMRATWGSFTVHEAEEPVLEEELPPVVYEKPTPAPKPEPSPQPVTKPKDEQTPHPQPLTTEPKEEPKQEPKEEPKEEPKPTPIPVKPTVVVVPPPAPAPEPIAPVKPKEDTYKRVTVAYFGTLITVGFPEKDNLRIATLNENNIADAWKKLSGEEYDVTVSTSLNARKANDLCDWAYLNLLRDVTEKQYGKTNEAVLVQAFLMTQSGYRIRLGMNGGKLYMLMASNYDIFGYRYYELDKTKFYVITSDKHSSMQICQAKYGKEQSLSMQIAQLPKLGSDPTPKRTLTSKKGVTSNVSVNKNMIDFFNTYPQACFNGDQTTRWAAYANTPMEKSIKDMLYPPLKKTITNMTERDAVGIILNWVQTAFEYEYDDKVWGGDRAFFAQETLYYPYCDCEDRAILFSRLVRDLMGLDVVLLYYPGHLATAVAFTNEEKGDWLTYKQRKYIVCDPTYINAGVGRTMPGMDNTQAQIIALK